MQVSNWEKIIKTRNFPPLNFISIEESQDRRDNLYKNFDEYEIKNVRSHIFKKYSDSEHVFVGQAHETYSVGQLGRAPVTSHLKAIKNWYFDTDEEYAFFCEDDISFETIAYWNFTWQEFFNRLPSNWECVQLCWVRENSMFMFSNNGLKLRNRCWCDWSGCAYLIKRSHAKKLISNYYRNGEFNLDYNGCDLEERTQEYSSWSIVPCIETIIFSNFSVSFVSLLFNSNYFSIYCSSLSSYFFISFLYWAIKSFSSSSSLSFELEFP